MKIRLSSKECDLTNDTQLKPIRSRHELEADERLQQVHGITLIQFQKSMNAPYGGNAADSDSTTCISTAQRVAFEMTSLIPDSLVF